MKENKIIAYKGFDENLCCRGFQYEIGKEYEYTGDIKCCKSGFHACSNPFDVLDYCGIDGKNRFCEVEQSEIMEISKDKTKNVSSKIRINAEIGITGLFKAGIEWIKEETNPKTIKKETELNGDCFIQDGAKIGSSGYGAQIGSSGDGAQIGSSGYGAKIGSSGYGAKIGSSGDDAQIVSSGDGAKIGSSGDGAKIDSIENDAVICCAGHNSIAKAKIGSWITLSEWKLSSSKHRFIPICVKTEYVDGKRIKEDTWYKLIGGEFVEQ